MSGGPAAWVGTASARRAAPPQVRAGGEPALLLLGLAWAAGAVHAAACALHVDEWPLAAVFFAVLAAAQFAWGVRVWTRPGPGLLTAGAAGSLAVVALWVVTRTSGLPVGPEAGRPEEAGVLDVVASVDELALAACALAILRAGGDSVVPRQLVVVVLVASLAAALLGGGHAH